MPVRIAIPINNEEDTTAAWNIFLFDENWNYKDRTAEFVRAVVGTTTYRYEVALTTHVDGELIMTTAGFLTKYSATTLERINNNAEQYFPYMTAPRGHLHVPDPAGDLYFTHSTISPRVGASMPYATLDDSALEVTPEVNFSPRAIVTDGNKIFMGGSTRGGGEPAGMARFSLDMATKEQEIAFDTTIGTWDGGLLLIDDYSDYIYCLEGGTTGAHVRKRLKSNLSTVDKEVDIKSRSEFLKYQDGFIHLIQSSTISDVDQDTYYRINPADLTIDHEVLLRDFLNEGIDGYFTDIEPQWYGYEQGKIYVLWVKFEEPRDVFAWAFNADPFEEIVVQKSLYDEAAAADFVQLGSFNYRAIIVDDFRLTKTPILSAAQAQQGSGIKLDWEYGE